MRVTESDLFVRLEKNGKSYPIENISVGGISFLLETDAPPCRINDLLSLEILRANKQVAVKATIKCVHVSSSHIGGAFVSMTRKTESLLDTLILDIQKQQIVLKNKRKRHAIRKS